MRKNYYKLSVSCLLFTLALNLSACNSTPSGSTIQNNNSDIVHTEATTEEINDKPTIEIEDIVWNIEEGIVNNERYVLLNYTNNSDFTISSLELTFTEKNNITEDEKATFYNEIKSLFDFSDDDLEEIKNQTITMHTKSEKVVEPLESASNIHCYYFGGFFYLKEINHYNLFQPDIATIKYVSDNKIYTVYYDFTSKKYSYENQTETAYNWSRYEIGSKIPKPDVKVLESTIDDEDTFMFDAYSFSLEDFNNYVNECKNLGFTIDESSFDGYYYANSADGYSISLHYNEDDCALNCTVNLLED